MTKANRQETQEEIERLYLEERQTLRQIAARFGVTHQRIHQRLREAGIDPISRARPVVSIDVDELRKLYSIQKLTIQKIAEHSGLSYRNIADELERHKIPRRRGTTRKTLDPEILKKLYIQENLSRVEVARKFKTSPAVVQRELKRRGIELVKRAGRRPPVFDKDQLFRLYVTERKSMFEIGRKLGHGRGAISVALQRFGISQKGKRNRKKSTF